MFATWRGAQQWRRLEPSESRDETLCGGDGLFGGSPPLQFRLILPRLTHPGMMTWHGTSMFIPRGNGNLNLMTDAMRAAVHRESDENNSVIPIGRHSYRIVLYYQQPMLFQMSAASQVVLLRYINTETFLATRLELIHTTMGECDRTGPSCEGTGTLAPRN